MPSKPSVLFCSTNSPFGRRFNKVAHRLKCEPAFVTNTEAAWKLILTGHFDLIICDHQEGQLDGLALLQQVKGNEATAIIPFVLYTSNKDGDVVSAVAAQGGAFVPQGTDDQWDKLLPQWLKLPSAA
jgi:CheY-like chemotaxis protein